MNVCVCGGVLYHLSAHVYPWSCPVDSYILLSESTSFFVCIKAPHSLCACCRWWRSWRMNVGPATLPTIPHCRWDTSLPSLHPRCCFLSRPLVIGTMLMQMWKDTWRKLQPFYLSLSKCNNHTSTSAVENQITVYKSHDSTTGALHSSANLRHWTFWFY